MVKRLDWSRLLRVRPGPRNRDDRKGCQVADEDLGTGTVTIEINDTRADQSLDRLAEKIEQKLDAAARVAGRRIELAVARSIRRISPARIEIEADLSRFNRALRTQTDLTDVAVEVPAVPKVSATQWRRMIQEAVADVEIKIKVVPDVSGFDRRIREITTPTIRADVETRVDNDRLTRSLSAIGSAVTGALGPLTAFAGTALKFGAIGIAAAGATQSIIGFTAALAPAAGILAAGPAVILGFAGALGALKLATAGVGDAFSAALTGDAKKFEKALDGLSPAAKRAAKEVRALKPAFEDLKNSVQDAFFKQFEGQITDTAKALKGPLKDGLSGISTEFGKAVNQLATFLQSGEAIGNITGVLGGTREALSTLGQAGQDVLQGFLAIGNSVAAAFGGELASGIATTAAKFGNFLFQAAASGQAVSWVDSALNTFAQLGNVLGHLGGILGAVFGAANTAGGNFLQNLGRILGDVENLVKSAQGTQTLIDVFAAIGTVAANLGPIIAALVAQLGGIVPALVPLFNTIGPAIVTVINALGPAIQGLLPGVQALVSGLADGFEQIASSGALTAIGQALGQIAVALAPILPLAGQLIGTLGNALAPVLSALAPVVGAVVGAVTGMVNAFSPLLTVAGQLIAQLGPILTPIVAALGQVFAAFGPIVQTLATILSSTLGPILGVLPSLLQPFLDAVTQLIGALLPPLNDLLTQLQPSLAQVSQALVEVVTALIPVITQVANLSVKILTALMPLLTPLIELIGDLASIFAGRLASVLTSVVVPALNVVSSLLKGDFSGAFNAMKEVVKGVISTVKDQFTQLPLAILNAVANFGVLLVSAGENLIRGMINGIKNMAGSLVSAAKDVVGDAVQGAKNLLGIKSPSRVFFVIGVQTGQGLVNGLDSMASKVGEAASSMAAAAVAPFDSLSVNGPTMNGVNTGSALAAITQPFGASGPGSLTTARTGRQAAVQGTAGGTGVPAIQNTFNITEVGDATTTAERVINRMVTAAGVFL